MANTLVNPDQLDDYPGAPFTPGVVDAAVGGLRGDVGWHIAPEVTETITVNGSPDQTLILPTLKIAQITAIRDVTGTTPVAVTGWRMASRAGLLWREEGWPCGFAAVEVDLVHGHADVPPELLPAVAWYCQQQLTDSSLSAEQLGAWSETYRNPASSLRSPVIEYPAAVIAKFNTQTEA